MIRPAVIADIKQLTDLYKRSVKYMFKESIMQWDTDYPNAEVFENDINAGTLYLMEDTEIQGAIVINEFQEVEYKNVKWLTPENSRNLVIHRLTTDPNHHRKGVASSLMRFAEELGVVNEYKSIRLDTHSTNPVANKFYENLDYQFVGEIFMFGNPKPFRCYEKVFV